MEASPACFAEDLSNSLTENHQGSCAPLVVVQHQILVCMPSNIHKHQTNYPSWHSNSSLLAIQEVWCGLRKVNLSFVFECSPNFPEENHSGSWIHWAVLQHQFFLCVPLSTCKHRPIGQSGNPKSSLSKIEVAWFVLVEASPACFAVCWPISQEENHLSFHAQSEVSQHPSLWCIPSSICKHQTTGHYEVPNSNLLETQEVWCGLRKVNLFFVFECSPNFLMRNHQ